MGSLPNESARRLQPDGRSKRLNYMRRGSCALLPILRAKRSAAPSHQRIGARVMTTARANNHDFVRPPGADEVIDCSSTDYVDAVGALTGGRGVDVVFDTIGGDTLTRSALVLAPLGRVVPIVDIAQPQNLIEARGRNASCHFVFTRQKRGKFDELTKLVERGLVRPVIGAMFPLERIGEARAYLEAGSANGLRGKVVITVNGYGSEAT